MSNFKINGMVTAVSPVKSGTSKKGEWKNCTITVKENEDKYPNEVSVSYMKSGENIKYFKVPSVGDIVDVEFTIRQREYNGKNYNDISVWNITNHTPQTVNSIVDSSDDPF